MIRRFVYYLTIAAIALAIPVVIASIFRTPDPSPKWIDESNRFQPAIRFIEDSHFERKDFELVPRGVSEVSALSSEALLAASYYFPFISYDEGSPDWEYRDSWRNPYLIIAEERDGEPWLGLFSMGRDGVSRSEGNDPDDFNTWSTAWKKHYRTHPQSERKIEETRVRRVMFVLTCLVASGVIFWILHASVASVSTISKKTK